MSLPFSLPSPSLSPRHSSLLSSPVFCSVQFYFLLIVKFWCVLFSSFLPFLFSFCILSFSLLLSSLLFSSPLFVFSIILYIIFLSPSLYSIQLSSSLFTPLFSSLPSSDLPFPPFLVPIFFAPSSLLFCFLSSYLFFLAYLVLYFPQFFFAFQFLHKVLEWRVGVI